MGEVACQGYHKAYGMKISIVRPFNPYGPRDYFDPDGSHVIPALIRKAVRRELPFVVWGDGNQERSFQYVTDVVRAFPLAVERLPNGEPINLGGSDAVRIGDLARCILRLTGFEAPIAFDRSKPQGVRSRKADATQVTQKLGWRPVVSLQDGLRRTIEWYKATAVT
jgi:GDP-L-fucose synthase